MSPKLSLNLPSSRRARLGVYSALVIGWLAIISLLISSFQHPDGVRGVAAYVVDQVKPGIDDLTKAKLARLDQLEAEAEAYHRNEIPDHYVETDNYSHQNQKGHQYMADIMLGYLLHQACRAADDTFIEILERPEGSVKDPIVGFSGTELLSEYDPWRLPYLRIRQNIDSQEYIKDGDPFCSSVRVRIDDGSKDGKPQLQPSVNEGFEQFEWNDKWFWKSEKPGSLITFPNITVVDGTVSLYFLRSWGHDMGDLKCWVDNDEAHASLLTGLWGFVSVGARALVAQDLKAGTYDVTCRSQRAKGGNGGDGGARTQIIAVMAT